MTNWTDIMVDLETTGTDTSQASIIQIGAVFFNLKEGVIGPKFSKNLSVSDREVTWEPGCLQWWTRDKDRKKILTDLLQNSFPPDMVIYEFVRWIRVNGVGRSLHFWSKPSHFDYNLLDRYFRKYGFENPFVYWKARDMRSYLLGLVFPEDLPELKLHSTDAHNALADVEFQVNELIRLTKERKRL